MSNSESGRFWLPNWMLGSGFFKELNAGELRVLLVYARLANKDGIILAIPSDMAAEVVGVPIETVPEIVAALVEKGALQKVAGGEDEYKLSTG